MLMLPCFQVPRLGSRLHAHHEQNTSYTALQAGFGGGWNVQWGTMEIRAEVWPLAWLSALIKVTKIQETKTDPVKLKKKKIWPGYLFARACQKKWCWLHLYIPNQINMSVRIPSAGGEMPRVILGVVFSTGTQTENHTTCLPQGWVPSGIYFCVKEDYS